MSNKWDQSTRWTSSAPAKKHGTNGNRRRGFVHADSDQTAIYVDDIAEDVQCRIARGIVIFRMFTNGFSMDLSELFTNRHDCKCKKRVESCFIFHQDLFLMTYS
jgi:hypothetical protein